MNEHTVAVVVGNALSTTGLLTAVESAQTISIIVSTIITVLGFILSVVVPFILKMIKKVKEAKADGKITVEEAQDIINDINKEIEDHKDEVIDIIDDIKKGSKN